MKLFVYASGYVDTPWKTEQQEIACVLDKRCLGGLDPRLVPFTRGYEWAPSNKDFASVGRASGGGSPAASVDDLLKVISQQSVESIEELRILGHANEDYLALAGTVVRDNVKFDVEEALIGLTPDLRYAVAFRQAIPKFHDLQDRFRADAKVVLLGCHSGSGASPDLLSSVSHAFLRTVAGFKKEISFDFEWGPWGPSVSEHRRVVCHQISRTPPSKISLRGKLLYDPQGDVSAQKAAGFSVEQAYKTNAWDLSPDMTSDVGDIFAAVQHNNPQELAKRILSEFFPNHPSISDIEILQQPKHGGLIELMMKEEISLAVRKHEGGMFIAVSPFYAQRTTPRTLAKRVAEMGKAIELVAKKAEGSIRFQ